MTPALVLGRGTASHAAPDERARSRRQRFGDEVLVLALDRRVGDLEDVEDIHGDVVGQVGKRSGHAEETDLSFVPKRLERLDGLVSLHLGSARRYVDL